MDTDKKVLLVDDHDLVRFGTSVLLESLDEVHCDLSLIHISEPTRPY